MVVETGLPKPTLTPSFQAARWTKPLNPPTNAMTSHWGDGPITRCTWSGIMQ